MTRHWVDPVTIVDEDNDVITANDWNAQIPNNMRESAAGKLVEAGQIVVGAGEKELVALDLGRNNSILCALSTEPHGVVWGYTPMRYKVIDIPIRVDDFTETTYANFVTAYGSFETEEWLDYWGAYLEYARFELFGHYLKKEGGDSHGRTYAHLEYWTGSAWADVTDSDAFVQKRWQDDWASHSGQRGGAVCTSALKTATTVESPTGATVPLRVSAKIVPDASTDVEGGTIWWARIVCRFNWNTSTAPAKHK